LNDALLMQITKDAEYARMIGLYYDRHAEYCHQNKFDYWVHSGPVRFSEHPSWDKFTLASQAFIMGYQYVVYLDADAYICDPDADLRDACIKPVNMVRWSFPLSHLQAGVMYFNNADGYAKAVCAHLLEEAKYYLEVEPDLRGWFEQGQIRELITHPEAGKRFFELPYEWNWGAHYCPPCAHPIVKAWHGVPEPGRTDEMRKEFGK